LVSDSGVEHVGGDMFESVPKGDAIFLKVPEFDRHLIFFCSVLDPKITNDD
jgi:hypothetical protein